MLCDSSITIGTRGKKQQHRLQKATPTGNTAMGERKQEQQNEMRTVKGGESYLIQEMGLSKPHYVVTGGQHNVGENEDNSNNLAAVQEVSEGTSYTTDGVTTVQISHFDSSKPT